ncbi:hypothetical protein [Culicoidibacter larvae]|uniref:Competence protein ComGF n=1 Tax=Culicoidibacter larvae TaxID=2579976 RepID=A0A5R8QEP8_9FIRM|nr:hypothetical protein [Culicoidibacter larvae]TLG76511.1 hypothetical protein FEZ08_02540 [Culicoidibacter larvae]
MFEMKKQGIFLIDCSIMMLASIVCFLIIWGELGYIKKIDDYKSISTDKLLYLATITNKLVNDKADININEGNLVTKFEDTVYLFQFKNNNLYLYKNGSGTQILMHEVEKVTFVRGDGLIRCVVIDKNKHYLEWGIVINE